MPDCIIVGGGAIGLLTARQLFLQGADVLLLEKGSLGGESSWKPGTDHVFGNRGQTTFF